MYDQKKHYLTVRIFFKSQLELLPIITAIRYKYTGMVIKKIIYINK